MADNFNFTEGAGKVGAADDVGGVLYQRVKIDYGGDGVAAPVTASSPLPVMPYGAVTSFVSGVTATIVNTTPVQVIPAQGAGVVIYVTDILVTNSQAGAETQVNITDGSGGTIKWTGSAIVGGGFMSNLNIPLVFTANTAVYAKCETTAAEVRVSISGFTI